MSKQAWLRHGLSPLGAIDRWLVAGVFERHVSYEPVRIDNGEQFINSWAVAGVPRFENPARTRFVAERRTAEVEPIDVSGVTAGAELTYGDQARRWSYYAPFGNPWVEHSEFWWGPTHIAEWALTATEASRDHDALVRVRTAGRVKVWLNGEAVVDFAPFNRNIPETTTRQVRLRAGANQWLVYHEDLAERDTGFKFRVDYQGAERLRISLPVNDVDLGDVVAVETALDDAFFDTDTTLEGEVVLHLTNALDRALPIDLAWWREWGKPRHAQRTLPPGGDRVVLGSLAEVGEGILTVEVAPQVGPVTVRKAFVEQVYPIRERTSSLEDADARRRRVLEIVAESGVDDLHKGHAMLRTGQDPAAIARIIDAEIERINQRLDCCDFSLIGAFRIWAEYRSSQVLPEELWSRLEDAIAGFRYWCDEPGDDVMWFFSENHALLFHASELLAGELFPDATFRNDHVTGAVHRERGQRRLAAWFENFRTQGLSEWNSNAYVPVVLMGLLALCDLAQEESLREEARAALDTVFEQVVAGSLAGVLATTQGRTYELELKGDLCNPMSCISWMAFGAGHPNSAVHGTVSYAVSSYAPPPATVDLERSLREHAAVYKLHQGPAGHADIYSYRVRGAQLASAVHHRPGTWGYQEHVVHATLGPNANVWVNHPGELIVTGSGRPCYWAGNRILPDVVQYRGFAIVTFLVPDEEEIDFTHAYFPTSEFDESANTGPNWWFARRADAYLGIYAHNGLELVSRGQTGGRELRSPGRDNIWLLRLADAREYGDFARFQAALAAVRIEVSDELTVDLDEPFYGAIHAAWHAPLRIGGTQQPTGAPAFRVAGELELLS